MTFGSLASMIRVSIPRTDRHAVPAVVTLAAGTIHFLVTSARDRRKARPLFHVQRTIGRDGNIRPCRLSSGAGAAFLNCFFRPRNRYSKIRKFSVIAETKLRDCTGGASQLPSPQAPPADFHLNRFPTARGSCQKFLQETLIAPSGTP
jgi:hypothetical protein